jgi:protein-export membrane protein SecD
MNTPAAPARAKRADPVVTSILIISGVLAVVAATLALWYWTRPRTFSAGEPRVELVLRVNTDAAVRGEAEDAMDRLRETLDRAGMSGATFTLEDPGRFTVSGIPDAHVSAFHQAAADVAPAYDIGSPGGGTFAFAMKGSAETAMRGETVAAVEQAIGRRLRDLGLAKWTVARQGGQGTDLLLVQIPPVADGSRVKDLIGASGILELKLVEKGPVPSREALLQEAGGTFPPLTQVLPGVEPIAGERTTVYYLVQHAPVLTGRDVKTAKAIQDENGRPAVAFTLNGAGAARLKRTTSKNIGRQLAIVLDGSVLSAPRIDGPIGEEGRISGGFTVREANDLALVLRSGGLAAPVTFLQERTVGGRSGR